MAETGADSGREWINREISIGVPTLRITIKQRWNYGAFLDDVVIHLALDDPGSIITSSRLSLTVSTYRGRVVRVT
ncbi:hypothetical protein O9929_15220 [Vibrio lentus]|nr:hypothetical protein [Vibrio lentus]